MTLLDQIFALTSHIRYVAVYRQGKLISRQRDDLRDASDGETDKYEELFVNPALLTLVRLRGEIDCGGARYVIVRYGNFYQLVVALPDGHVSVCFELGENPLTFVDKIHELCVSPPLATRAD